MPQITKINLPVFRFFAALAFICFLQTPASAALPRFLGGSGVGISGNKGNIEGSYPTFWDNLMLQQSYSNMRQGLQEMSAYKYKEAAASFGKAVIKNPKEAYPHIFLGMALYWQGQVDGAIAEYRAALELDPDNDDARQLLGIAYAWKGNIQAALEEFKKAIEINPKRADAQMNIGSTYAALGMMDETLFHFRNAVNLDKRHPLYHYQLASAYERLGRDALAEESFKKAISLYPRYGEALLALGVLYEKMGKNTPAEINYKKTLRVKPGDSIARLRLVNLLAAQGRHNEIIDILNRGFLISPLSNEGLALSFAYTGGGAPGAEQQANRQLEQFKKRLLKVPSSKQLTIEVELALTPKLLPKQIDTAPKGDLSIPQPKSALASAVEKQLEEETTRAFSRTFILAGANDEERRAQLQRITEDFENVLAAAGEKYDINMSLRAGMPVTDTASLAAQASPLGPASAFGRGAGSGKAGYNPYMVGNDMGLWTPNKSWVSYIDEIMPDILGRLDSNAKDYLVAGLAFIALGRGEPALENFTRAAELAGQGADRLKILQAAGLGKGTAYIVLGDEQAALAEYRNVLALNPANEIAKANIAVLED